MWPELNGGLHGCAGCEYDGVIHRTCYALKKPIKNTERSVPPDPVKIISDNGQEELAQVVLGLAQEV